ncbi:MAG: 5-formyltetrahydrofolate cyclo-ligase, partial [Phycisphaeraceae bacterium]
MNGSPSKADLRKRYRAIRDAIPEHDLIERGAAIDRSVRSIDRVERSSSVFVYVSSKGEMPTQVLIATLLRGGKVVCVPHMLPEPGVMQRAAEGMDAIIHVAAKPGVWGSYESYHHPNVTGTERVLEA